MFDSILDYISGNIGLIVGILTPIINIVIIPPLFNLFRQIGLDKWIDRMVEAAEELYGSESGEIKKKYVMDELIIKTNGKMSEKVLSSLIESAVRRLKNRNLEVQGRTKSQENNVKENKNNNKITLG